MAQTTEDRAGAIRRITLWGLAVNLVLAIAKGVGGYVGASQALLADAVHSFSDLSTDIGLLVGLRYWSKPKDADHPYGHGRIEQVVSLGLALVLTITAVGIVWHSVDSLAETHSDARPGILALIVALISIVVKEVLYRVTDRVARQVNSSALLGNAWHHRSDALSSIPAVLAIALSMAAPELGFVDHIGAVVVAFFILQAAGKIAFPSLGQLVDAAAPDALRKAIFDATHEVEGVREAHAMRTRYLGADVAVDLHVEVDPDLSVRAGHDIAEAVVEHLRTGIPEVVDVVVHVEPWDEHAPRASATRRMQRP